jgi:glycosyltransferase involved in cell wall biosynthesis
MKILHACLANYYIDDMGYQENMLVRQNHSDGHDVLVISSTETLSPKNVLTYQHPGTYIGTDGARVIRLSYVGFLPSILAKKVRAYSGLRKELDRFNPDVVLFHGLSSLAAITVAHWCRRRGKPFFVDTHSDANNSGRSFFSREVLHKKFYGRIARFAARRARKVLCVSRDTLDFAHEIYRIEQDQLELFPLGGIIPSTDEKKGARQEWQKRLGIDADTILIVQSGKFGHLKRLDVTLASLKKVTHKNFHVVLAGTFDPALEIEFQKHLCDFANVSHIGWVPPDTLFRLLAAADIYLQPGSQSVTMQQAICSGCAVMLDNVKSHEPYISDNGILIDGQVPFAGLLDDWLSNPDYIRKMEKNSVSIARQMLDYRILANRVLPQNTQEML